MTGYELMVYNLDLQSRTERLAQLDPGELRRRGVQAASSRDAAELWALMEAYLVLRGSRGVRVSGHTLRSYRQGLDTFLEWAAPAGVTLLRPRPNEAFAYLRWLEAQQLSPGSVKVRLAGARCLYAALRWSGATDAAPFTDIKAPADPVPRSEKRKPYSEEDVSKLVSHADPQERVIVLLGAHAGLRNSEILSLTRPDIHLEASEPYLTVTGKRQKRQDVAIGASLKRALEVWMRSTEQLAPRLLSPTLTTSETVRTRLEALCDRAGVEYERRAVHGLRHSAGTRVYVETKDLLEVRDHLRHRDITSSEIYVEYARKGKPKVNRDW